MNQSKEQPIKGEYDCSYDFENYSIAKKYRYIVITDGDLDLNGAIMIRNRKSLIAYLNENAGYGRKVLQIFEATAIVNSQQSKSAKSKYSKLKP